MATRNGEKYISQQLDSILSQLKPTDELIITDDCSGDGTVSIIRSFDDDRIRLTTNARPAGIAQTFQSSLMRCRGDYIFLADQDDVWLPQKVNVMLRHLSDHDLVISDCKVVDHQLVPKSRSFQALNNSGKGLIKNILRNSYMGCCMAFNRGLLKRALPIPTDIPLHDFWIGLIGELYFKVKFIPDILIYHRRHLTNASTNGSLSRASLSTKVLTRYRLIRNLLLHRSYAY